MSDSKYKKENYRNVVILIPRDNEKTIEYLEEHKPISKYIRKLIKEDIESNCNEWCFSFYSDGADPFIKKLSTFVVLWTYCATEYTDLMVFYKLKGNQFHNHYRYIEYVTNRR